MLACCSMTRTTGSCRSWPFDSRRPSSLRSGSLYFYSCFCFCSSCSSSCSGGQQQEISFTRAKHYMGRTCSEGDGHNRSIKQRDVLVHCSFEVPCETHSGQELQGFRFRFSTSAPKVRGGGCPCRREHEKRKPPWRRGKGTIC